MNWLAHVLLSEEKIDFQIGNFMADPYKAKPWENASEDLKNGMTIHKQIDSFTDRHEIFKKSKSRLKEKGILKSIIIDLTYDYLLTKNWDKFCNIPLNQFKNDFYEEALQRGNHLPTRANTIIQNLVQKDLLNFEGYEHLELSFKRLDRRLSEKLAKRDNAISYLEIVKENIKDLEKDFLYFFPLLINEIQKNLDKKHLKHLKYLN